ncbi:protein kinase, putative [Trypanosoma cruzi]|nr:protein kinase, putative [Trypanosoma cruzi]
MPKFNKKTRGWCAKKNGKSAPTKKKTKYIDPCGTNEVDASINTATEEVESHEEPLGQPHFSKIKRKKNDKLQLQEIGRLTLKPGMTVAQAHEKANKVYQQKPLQNIPDPSFEEEEEGYEEGEEDHGGSDEDYSDTANERSVEYRKGGYHPVVVGEVYHDRYRVVRKLGWGYFSTVWLVWDYVTKRYQALKVQKSAKHYTEAAYDEIKLLGEIMSSDPDKTCCCARMNDYFEHTGPNGVHVCMVFDVYGEDLLSLIDRYEYRGVPLPIVKCISRQVLVGLEHLHSLDIIHTDLKPENVLLSSPKHAIISLMKRYHPPPLHQRLRLVERDPKTMTKSQRRRYYKKLKAIEQNGKKNENISEKDNQCATAKTHKNSIEQNREQDQAEAISESETDSDWEIERLHHVVLADFGNSCWTYRQFTDEVQTRQYRCPEVILGEPYSTPIDLWSAACLIFELITGEFLFDPRKGENYSRDEDHLALMTELLGDLPESMRLGEGKYRSQFYNSRGALRNIKDLNFWSLDDVLYRKHKFTRKKAEEIADFLLPMLEFDPQKRATATEMLANFEHFFEIKEDDYSPFCFVSSDADREMVEASTSNEEDSETSGDSNDADDESENTSLGRGKTRCGNKEMDSAQFWDEHPLLAREFLEKRGLSLLDIHDLLAGKELEDPAAHKSALEVIHLLSEEAADTRGEGHADRDGDATSRVEELNNSISDAGSD